MFLAIAIFFTSWSVSIGVVITFVVFQGLTVPFTEILFPYFGESLPKIHGINPKYYPGHHLPLSLCCCKDRFSQFVPLGLTAGF